MKLSEIRGERVLDVLADLIEPVANIAGDETLAGLFRGERQKDETNRAYGTRQVKQHLPRLLRTHKHDLIAILAALDGVTPEAYAKDLTLMRLPAAVLDLLNDEALMQLFTSAEPKGEKKPSGSAGTKQSV